MRASIIPVLALALIACEETHSAGDAAPARPGDAAPVDTAPVDAFEGDAFTGDAIDGGTPDDREASPPRLIASAPPADALIAGPTVTITTRWAAERVVDHVEAARLAHADDAEGVPLAPGWRDRATWYFQVPLDDAAPGDTVFVRVTATDRDGVTTGKILRWTAGFPVAGRVMPGPARHMEIIAELPDDRGRWWTVATGSTTADGHFHLALPTRPDGPIGLVAKATEGTTIIDPEGHALAWPDQVLRSYVLPAHFNRPALVTPWTTLAWWLAQPVDPDLAERFAAYAEALAAHLQLRPERDLLVGEGERDHHLLSLACFVGATAAQESPLTYLRDLRMDALDHRLTGTFPDAGEGRDPLRRELAEGCPDDASFSWMARVIANNDARLFGPYGGRKVDVVAPEVTVELIEAGGLIRTLPGGEHALSGPVTLVITAQDDVSSPQAPQIRLDGRLGPAALTDVERHTPRPHQLVVRGTLDPAALPPGVPVVLDVTVADEAGNQTRNTLNIIGFSDAVEPTVDIRGATEAMPGVWVLRRGEPTTARLEFRTGSLRTALVTLDGGALQASAVEAASQLTTPLALEAAPDGRYALRWDAVDVFDRPVVATAELIVDHTPPRITWLPTTYRDERDARVVLGPDGPEIVIGDTQVELGPDQPQPLPLYKLTSRLDDADDPNPAALRWQVDGEEFSDRVRFGAIGGPVARRVDAITWQIGLTTATTGFGPRTAPGDTWPRQARELVAVDLAGNEARVSLPTVVAALVAPPLHIEALELAAQGDALAPADVASLDRVDGRHLVGRWRLRNPWPEARIVQPAHLALDVDVATRLRPAGGPAEILGVGRAEGDELIFERPGQLDRRVVLGCLAGAGRGQMAEAVELPAGGLLEAYLRIRLYRCLARQGEGPLQGQAPVELRWREGAVRLEGGAVVIPAGASAVLEASVDVLDVRRSHPELDAQLRGQAAGIAHGVFLDLDDRARYLLWNDAICVPFQRCEQGWWLTRRVRTIAGADLSLPAVSLATQVEGAAWAQPLDVSTEARRWTLLP
ncbi:MAG: hypothetical protein R3F60_18045 [bacterium]